MLAISTLVLAGLVAMALGGAWRDRTDQAAAVRLEQRGIGYLHPLTSLVGQLVQAQTAAVRGDEVDAAKLRKAIASLYDVNARDGAALGASERFRELNTRTEAALSSAADPKSSATPSERLETWSAVVALAIELVRAVGESSALSFDAHADAFYLAQAATVYLPDAMMQAGRATGLATLAGTQRLTGDNAVRAGVARYAVAADSEAATSGLNRSVANTDSHELGSAIARALEVFRAAVAAFTPPTAVAQPDSVAADQLSTGATAIFTSALALTHSLLTQTGKLLTTRTAALNSTRHNHLATAIAGGAAVLLALAGLFRRRRRPTATPPAPPPTTPTGRAGGTRATRQPALTLAASGGPTGAG
jgi:hypothetical protein